MNQDVGCSNKKNFNISIVLTTCTDDEFTSKDGFCINMRERCDKIFDCPNDSLDEESCGMIVFDSTYRK